MRDRQFNMIVGFPGHGKSTMAAKLVKNSADANALIYKEGLDIDDSAYLYFPECSIWNYRGGKVKINSEEIEYLAFLDLVLKRFRNGSLVVDEGGLHEQDILSKQMKAIAALRRKIGVDVTIMYHGLSDLPIRQFQYVNNIVLFHTTDNIKYKASRIPKMDEIQAAQERIAARVARGDKYAHEVIKLT